jgi:hypothetical protein
MNDVQAKQLAATGRDEPVQLLTEISADMYRSLLTFLDANPGMTQNDVLVKGLLATGVINREMV